MHTRTLAAVGVAWMLGGCSLIPEYQRPDAPVPTHYPHDGVYRQAQAGALPDAVDWRQLFHDPALAPLIDAALVNNRDLRVAALNVQAFQAQYRIQRADLFPAVSATGAGKRQKLPEGVTGTGKSAITSNYSATLGLSAYELDLFGRVRSLSEQAMLTYLGTEQARRSAQLSLVANVANAYLTWRADQELLALAEQTLAANDRSWQLTSRSKTAGKASALDVVQARTAVESTRASVARYERQVAQDLNNLTLLVGGPVDANLPARPLADDLVARVPAGLPSDLLQRRPDILQAEYQLQAANANIGAARAAFFPSITLTANAGSTSTQLSGLFKGGAGTWTFQPQINLPIFNAGSLRASLDYAKLQKDITVAQYEKSIQTAFQEVADGLAARQTFNDQLDAQRDFVAANQRYYDLAQHRYRSGVDSNLTFLDAQRALFNSQQALIVDRLAQLVAQVNLYTALGGAWDQPPSLATAR
ncbi:AdeC/AdeK/OprM family multidrug efflux complex outer membrane factor [Pseudomonas fluorescens]|uniref:AdeC/AdeK/OprM family multidrug efflux complex outer membrane factor n=1 Tax=Pseudomonas fluorescens TaxID=294 RepID=UPI0017839BD8|nr:AdeC/AdeK/OprM family multidrug efflux complex outer membrane factor [Pseudomonas fluorescens]MBD8097118.1 AdeC/AdeK/OprM family multidrug efflux complex outer membrane factor [Pseudomonas fluorescens]MBD8773094.1 AdeC/AdeK/OprM family multidrug efflux complex outer membrane factor [Pseudomonas fluorescens]MBD8777424.1 AdeC/AdeK/OprM family multidrug efflux complex outer membrane factor [Pseudomonas fluorescens]MBD8794026.1 AdeC/AdeK/OprM family multidrug efflux complex outer membrane factor